MKVRLMVRAAVAAAVLMGAAGQATAQSTDCNLPSALPPDGRSAYPYGIANGATQWFVLQNLQVGRQYTVEMLNLLTGTFAGDLTIYDIATVAGDCTGGTVTPTLTITGHDPSIGNFGRRRTFSPAATGNYLVKIVNATGSGKTYSLIADETTMFSPAWSTGGTYATYYSFFNTSSLSVDLTLTLTTAAGVTAGTTTLSVPPQRNVSTNTVALGIPAGGAGNARLLHNGSPGTIIVEADIANFSSVPAFIQPVKFQTTRESRH